MEEGTGKGKTMTGFHSSLYGMLFWHSNPLILKTVKVSIIVFLDAVMEEGTGKGKTMTGFHSSLYGMLFWHSNLLIL
jgi:hypothetical protein